MKKLKDIPIKYQLIVIIFTISLVSLLVASTAFVLYDRQAYKKNMELELTILARIISSQSVDAIKNNDGSDIDKNLNSLGVKKSIVSACISDLNGEILAQYTRDSDHHNVCLNNQEFISQFKSNYFDVLQPVMGLGVKKIAQLHIRQDLSLLNKRSAIFLVIILLIVIGSSLLTVFLSSRIQAFISEPLIKLIVLANQIKANQDYSLRTDVTRGDEVGQLEQAINSMLDRIEAQNQAVLNTKEMLEEQVEERTLELKTINEELEAFIYSVSHDLRAPLRSIDGFSQALQEDCGDRFDAVGKDYLLRIQAASGQMGVLIDSLLYLSRVSQQELKMQAVNFSELADELTWSIEEHYPACSTSFIRPKALLAYGDKSLLRVVLENLLGNAWKYSAKVASPQVELGSVEREGKTIYFVRDNGAGFDMSYVESLFRPFQRLHRSDDFEGLGVGLATVARIIHRHGGEIWAEGIVGSGAVFYFTLGLNHEFR